MQPYLKFIVIFNVLLLWSFTSEAQRPSSISLTYSLSGPNQIHMLEELVHYPQLTDYKYSTSHSFGIRYLLKSKKAVTLETGLEFVRFTSQREINPDYPNTLFMMIALPAPRICDIITVPIYANIAFWKYFFFNGGVLMDINANKEHQQHSGLGTGFGLGAQYNYKKINFFLNPFLKSHSLITFKNDPHTITNISVKAGIGYTF